MKRKQSGRSVLKAKRRKLKEKQREQKIKQIDDLIRYHLKSSEVDLQRLLRIFDCSGEVFESFLRAKNYYVFDWAVEHVCLPVLDYLIREVRPEHHLLMVSHDDYTSVRHFISQSTQNFSYSEKSIENRKSVLARLLSLGSGVKEVVEAVMEDEAHDPCGFREVLLSENKSLMSIIDVENRVFPFVPSVPRIMRKKSTKDDGSPVASHVSFQFGQS